MAEALTQLGFVGRTCFGGNHSENRRNLVEKGGRMQIENDALEAIGRYVECGFYNMDQIVRIIDEDILGPGQIDKIWLRIRISNAIRAKKAAEKSWPKITDCDRIDRAFETLGEKGVIALQNSGNTLSDGISDVSEFYTDAGGDGSGYDGYCFYHGQDLWRVMESGDLYIAFGSIETNETLAVEVGHRVRSALESTGLKVVRDRTIDTCLLIRPMNWQKRWGHF